MESPLIERSGQTYSVRAFLVGTGVECEDASSAGLDVRQQLKKFVGSGGTILTCGACLKIKK